jgi:ribose transport system permease protein
MKHDRPRLLLGLLRWAPFLLALGVLAAFGIRSEKFRDPGNLVNLLTQAAPIGVLAVGETFVILTAGVDLSVGAVMFVAAAVGGKLALAGTPLPVALLAMAAIGMAGGAANALGVVGLGLAPFVITLATLFLGRGIGLWITETRAMNLPGELLSMGAARVLGVPAPIWIFGLVLAGAHLTLTRTPFGRRLYAVGHDREAARKAGIPVGRHLAAAYAICGLCAGVSAILTLVQLGAVSPTFGKDREFAAIAAAVLGGVSLTGGRGGVFPGTFVGAVLFQSIASGLVILDADPYLHPLITGAIIFAAVLLDSMRGSLLAKVSRGTGRRKATRQ